MMCFDVSVVHFVNVNKTLFFFCSQIKFRKNQIITRHVACNEAIINSVFFHYMESNVVCYQTNILGI